MKVLRITMLTVATLLLVSGLFWSSPYADDQHHELARLNFIGAIAAAFLAIAASEPYR